MTPGFYDSLIQKTKKKCEMKKLSPELGKTTDQDD